MFAYDANHDGAHQPTDALELMLTVQRIVVPRHEHGTRIVRQRTRGNGYYQSKESEATLSYIANTGVGCDSRPTALVRFTQGA